MQRFDVRREFQGTFTKRRATTRYIVVHHAAALYRQLSGLDDVMAIRNYHVNTKRWPGVAYHIVLAELVNGGEIARYDVSDLDTQRAHIAMRNHEALGVCCATRFDGTPSVKWLAALGETLRELKATYPQAEIVGHTDIAVAGYQTTCPGKTWREWRPLLMAAVTNLTTPAAPTSYRVKAPAGANVRELPNRMASILTTLIESQTVVGYKTQGDSVTLKGFGTSSEWIRLADGSGYIWRPLLDAI